MQPYLRLWPSAAGLHFEVAEPADRVVDVLLDGRRVWSFREPSAGAAPGALPADLPADAVPERIRFEPWPRSLQPMLRGTFRVALRPSGETGEVAAALTLDGDPGPLRVVDVHDRPLVVNKWGRLGHAIADAPAGLADRMVGSTDRVRQVLEAHLGPTVYLSYGSLLGPVRENGRLMPHDDDVDLSYLSRHAHPADVALEAFEVGRLLHEAGLEAIRLSVAHVQVLFGHDGVPDHYVDVFTGFHLEGFWYQHFAIRAAVPVDQLLPPSQVVMEGSLQPAPRVPEVSLEQIYGPGWRVPDPSFTFKLPAETGERFYGWFADYNVDREHWEDVVLLAPARAAAPTPQVSDFTSWAVGQAPADAAVLELGCGTGDDALALGLQGRVVRAVDYSRHAIGVGRRRQAGLAPDGLRSTVSLDVVNLLDSRTVLRLGAELAGGSRPWSVVGRRLLNAIEDRGRDNVFRLCGMLLRRGGVACFDVVADHGYPGIPPHRHLTIEQLVAEAQRHRLVLTGSTQVVEPITWLDAPEERRVPLTRLTFTRRS